MYQLCHDSVILRHASKIYPLTHKWAKRCIAKSFISQSISLGADHLISCGRGGERGGRLFSCKYFIIGHISTATCFFLFYIHSFNSGVFEARKTFVCFILFDCANFYFTISSIHHPPPPKKMAGPLLYGADWYQDRMTKLVGLKGLKRKWGRNTSKIKSLSRVSNCLFRLFV